MNMKRKIIIILSAALVIALFLSACGNKKPTATEPSVTVKKLVIETPPDKTTYEVGDMFDPTGVKINAEMSDGTVKENVSCEVDITEPLTKSVREITFSYGGKKVKQSISVLSKGNAEEYSVANTEEIPNSPLAGKVYFFLGSSVTAGTGAGGESMADFIAKRNAATCIKEAVAGTNLAGGSEQSYVSRFEKYLDSEGCVDHLDAFICQLSTNDRSNPDAFGIVTADDVRDADAFDKNTTYGAMEYIIVRAREKWDCPVLFYTNSAMDDENYDAVVDALYQIQAKWDIGIIDLYNDEEFNNITEEEYALYMSDKIHPTKAGYRDWWVPKFEEALLNLA